RILLDVRIRVGRGPAIGTGIAAVGQRRLGPILTRARVDEGRLHLGGVFLRTRAEDELVVIVRASRYDSRDENETESPWHNVPPTLTAWGPSDRSVRMTLPGRRATSSGLVSGLPVTSRIEPTVAPTSATPKPTLAMICARRPLSTSFARVGEQRPPGH